MNAPRHQGSAEAEAEAAAHGTSQREARRDFRATEPGKKHEKEQRPQDQTGPDLRPRFVRAGEVDQHRLVDPLPAEVYPAEDQHQGKNQLRRGETFPDKGHPDHRTSQQAPRGTLHRQAGQTHGVGCGCNDQADGVAITLLAAEADADRTERRDESRRFGVAVQQQAQSQGHHRAGDHGTQRSSANKAAQAPAQRHRHCGENTKHPHTAML